MVIHRSIEVGIFLPAINTKHWPNQRREHIYRCHRQPPYKCNRCYESFETNDSLEGHQRADVPCKVSAPKPLDGINEAQYQQLRKKTSSSKPNTERWEEIYRIIYPNAVTLPSPCKTQRVECRRMYVANISTDYEYNDGKAPAESFTDPLDVRDEVLTRMRNELEDRFDQFEDNTRKQLNNILVDIIGKIRKESFQGKPSKVGVGQQATTAAPLSFAVPDFDFDALLFESQHTPAFDYHSDPSFGGIGIHEYNVGSSHSEVDSSYYSADSPTSFAKV
jgi:hypothetical protein